MELGNFIDENNHGEFMDIDDAVFVHPEMEVEENASPRVLNESPKRRWDWKRDIARCLMSGHHSEYVLDRYGKMISVHPRKDRILKYLSLNDGLLGYVFVDTSFFGDDFGYSDIPEVMRQYNLYAIHSPAVIYCSTKVLESTGDGTIDGMLNCEDEVSSRSMVIDGYTNLPIASCLEDVEGLDAVFDLLLENGRIGESECRRMRESDSPLACLRGFWRNEFRRKFGKSSRSYDDSVSDYDVRDQSLDADSVNAPGEAEVFNSLEGRMDDIGDIPGPLSVDVRNDAEESHDGVYDEVYEIDVPEISFRGVDERELLDSERNVKMDDISELDSGKIEIESGAPEAFDGNSAFFDDIGVGGGSAEVDEAEFFSEGLSEDDIDFDAKPKKIDVSNNYSFDW